MNNSIEENDVIEIDIREIAGMFFSKLRLIISVGLFSALLMFNFSIIGSMLKYLGCVDFIFLSMFVNVMFLL